MEEWQSARRAIASVCYIFSSRYLPSPHPCFRSAPSSRKSNISSLHRSVTNHRPPLLLHRPWERRRTPRRPLKWNRSAAAPHSAPQHCLAGGRLGGCPSSAAGVTGRSSGFRSTRDGCTGAVRSACNHTLLCARCHCAEWPHSSPISRSAIACHVCITVGPEKLL